MLCIYIYIYIYTYFPSRGGATRVANSAVQCHKGRATQGLHKGAEGYSIRGRTTQGGRLYICSLPGSLEPWRLDLQSWIQGFCRTMQGSYVCQQRNLAYNTRILPYKTRPRTPSDAWARRSRQLVLQRPLLFPLVGLALCWPPSPPSSLPVGYYY